MSRTDPNNTPSQGENNCRCCECGYEWIRGQSGAHRCTPYLQATIASLRAALAKVEEERDENHMHAIAADERAEAAEAKLALAKAALEKIRQYISRSCAASGIVDYEDLRDIDGMAANVLAAIREVKP